MKNIPYFLFIIFLFASGHVYANKNLIDAIINQDVNAVQIILDKLNKDDLIHDINQAEKSYNNETPLIAAIRIGDQKKVQLLIDYGADIEKEGPNNYTPLMYAIVKKNSDLVNLLLNNKANANKKNSLGQAPLRIAAGTKSLDLVKLLLDKVPDIDINIKDKKNGNTVLMYAAKRGLKDILILLMNEGALFDITNDVGDTFLIIAVREDRSEIVEEILKRTPYWFIKKINKEGKNALFYANNKIKQLLIDYGA